MDNDRGNWGIRESNWGIRESNRVALDFVQLSLNSSLSSSTNKKQTNKKKHVLCTVLTSKPFFPRVVVKPEVDWLVFYRIITQSPRKFCDKAATFN